MLWKITHWKCKRQSASLWVARRRRKVVLQGPAQISLAPAVPTAYQTAASGFAARKKRRYTRSMQTIFEPSTANIWDAWRRGHNGVMENNLDSLLTNSTLSIPNLINTSTTIFNNLNSLSTNSILSISNLNNTSTTNFNQWNSKVDFSAIVSSQVWLVRLRRDTYLNSAYLVQVVGSLLSILTSMIIQLRDSSICILGKSRNNAYWLERFGTSRRFEALEPQGTGLASPESSLREGQAWALGPHNHLTLTTPTIEPAPHCIITYPTTVTSYDTMDSDQAPRSWWERGGGGALWWTL